MAAQAARDYCEGCTRKDHCEYKPTSGTLLRCLDKQIATAQPSSDPYSEETANA